MSPLTRSEWVDAQLRRAILNGELAPGEKLRAEHLAQQFGVSPTPLRETFMRLAGEGLVVVEPQRGARVAPVDVADAADLYEVRLLLDPVAVERSVRHAVDTGTLGDYARKVTAAHEAMTTPPASVAAAHEAHRGFHLALVSWCANRQLLRQVTHLLDHSQRFHAVGAGRLRRSDPAVEHRALAAAAVAGDDARAADLMRSHLAATLHAVRTAAGSAPEAH